jgi:putative ABC transport system substrate-binding protein
MAIGGTAPAQAAKAATATIPIVFTGGVDPVRAGLVASPSRPGGNATGVINISSELTEKRLQLLRELVPQAEVIAVLFNPASPDAAEQIQEMRQAAVTIGQQIVLVTRDLPKAMKRIAKVRKPSRDPVFGTRGGSTSLWKTGRS